MRTNLRVVIGLVIGLAVLVKPALPGGIEATAEYASRDFAPLIMPKTPFLGYIGADYQRMDIRFTSVVRDPANTGIYRVKGTSEVKGNRCDFEGTITVDRIERLQPMHYGVDDEYESKGLEAQGIVTARYEFREDPAQKHVGVFKGVMTLAWYIDRDGVLRYDDIETYSDAYRNNQYEGTWTAYEQGAEPKKANWGEYRIPDSRALDRGAAEFSPDPKFPGWEDYDRERGR